MKKLLIAMVVVFLLVNLPVKNPMFNTQLLATKKATYAFYVKDDVNYLTDYITVDNAGLGNIIYCAYEYSGFVKKGLTNIVGESVSFLGSVEEALDLLGYYSAKAVKTERIEGDLYNIYAYSKYFSNSIYLGENKINLQICYRKGVVTLGSPIILGDY